MGGEHDFDWLVIGFGGSVSALRLAEKGYHVAVLESGRRQDEDFAETTWNARRYYWLPRLGLQTQEDADNPNPRFIAVADQVTRRAAEKLDATPQTGVVDAHHRAFGYESLLVCDGSAIPANIGVNPSLRITAWPSTR